VLRESDFLVAAAKASKGGNTTAVAVLHNFGRIPVKAPAPIAGGCPETVSVRTRESPEEFPKTYHANKAAVE
jgi:hypothetical protein